MLPYAVLGGAAALEYVFPPLPGDTVTLFGAFLAASAGYSPWLVYAVLTAGALGGSLVAYAFGAWVGRNEDRWPRFMRGDRTRRAIRTACDRFERHGAAYLVINRFLPALRAVFFVAAGMAGMPVWKVAVFGGVSAAIWNALILAAGYGLGANWERLRTFYETYTKWTLAAVAALVLVLFARWLIGRRARSRSGGT